MDFPEYPSWVEGFRPEQNIATERIVDAFKQGTRIVLVDGPTGCGKSLIPEMVRREMGYERCLYSCSGLELQSQLSRDFNFMTEIRGRANYPTELFPSSFDLTGMDRITCGDCTYLTERGCHYCSSKGNCTYEIAKIRALNDPLVNMNTSYFLSETNYVGQFRGADLVTIDEADTLDQQLMSFVEIRVTRKVQRELSIKAPRHSTKIESWAAWYHQTLATLGSFVENTNVKELDRPDEIKLYNRCKSLHQQLLDAGDLDDQWSYVGNSDDEIVFRPVEPAPWGPSKVFRHGKRFLLMSATLISGDVVADELGVDEPYEVIYLPSPFKPENRPIRFVPVADMSYKGRVEAIEKVGKAIGRIMEQHPGDRILIHTHTYGNAKKLEEMLRGPRRVLTYSSSRNRHSVLEEYKKTPGAVLLAPSMERGIDLPDDLCRVVVVAQLPYPYIGDKQVAKRVYGTGRRGRRWLLCETMRALVQMTGRGVRHEDDYATSYILDARAPKFVDQCRREGVAVKWWTDAIERGPWLKVLGLEG